MDIGSLVNDHQKLVAVALACGVAVPELIRIYVGERLKRDANSYFSRQEVLGRTSGTAYKIRREGGSI